MSNTIPIPESIKRWDDETYWEERGDCLEDVLHDHFQKTELRDWPDISREAVRVWGAMFDQEIEEGCAIDSLIAAACAQVEDGVIDAMARMMGVDKKALHSALAHWIESNGEPYDSIKSAELCNLIERVKKDEESDSYE